MTNINEQRPKSKKIAIRPITLVISVILIILVVGVSTAVFTFLGTAKLYSGNHSVQITDSDLAKYARLEELSNFIKENYINTTDDQKMLDGAAKGLVFGIEDPYAAYFTPEEYAEFAQAEKGTYVGIGVLVNQDQKDKTLTVAQVYRESPADKAGILAGDKIIGVNSESVIGMDFMQVVDMVRGEAGTEVSVTFLRDGEDMEITMVRAEVTAERVEWRMVEDEIGYIKLYEFSGNCSELFHEALDDLIGKGAKGFILDLRYNPGGDKNIVVSIADTLFPKGPIITLEDNKGNRTIDSSDAKYLNMPLVALINEHSASASELLSGGIQDYGVGTLVGETTFGKGVAQSFTGFDDGAVLRLTTDRYLTPNGRCPQDVGIVPDVEIALDEKVKDNPLLLTTKEDNQMQKALEILRKEIQ